MLQSWFLRKEMREHLSQELIFTHRTKKRPLVVDGVVKPAVDAEKLDAEKPDTTDIILDEKQIVEENRG